jgi:hypothetical protein
MSYSVRMSILGTILLVAVCALGWEYGVVIRSFNGAQAKLNKLSDENIAKAADEALTMADVKQVLSQPPSEIKTFSPRQKKGDDDKTMRGMMFERHDQYNFHHVLWWKPPERLIVVYKRLLKSEEELKQDIESFDDQEWIFIAVHSNMDVPESARSAVSKDAVNPGDFPSAPGGGSAPGAPGGKGPGGKGGGKGGPGGGGAPRDPEAIFKENDKDKDGKLTGDEIPTGMSRFVDRIDEDKDGSISLAEMKAAMERFSKQGKKGPGGRGPGGNQPGGKRPGGKNTRPALEKNESSEGGKESAQPGKFPAEKIDAKPAEKKSEKSN